MKKNEAIEALRDIADDTGGDFREDYSGRGMYGEECVGIVTDTPMHVIEEAAEKGIRGAKQDSMGKRTIVYWPSLKIQE